MKLLCSKAFFIGVFTLSLAVMIKVHAQTKVVLDNYYNHEIDPKTGQAFHYLWSDKANSGFSEWGEIFKEKGAALGTLKEAPTTNNLRDADIYIIVDPDTKAETASPHYILKRDIRNMVKWVKQGGVLVLMANDSGNCEFQHLNQLAGHFGMHFNEVSLNHVNGHEWEMGAITHLPDGPVFSGVNKIYMKEVSSLTLSSPARSVLSKDGHVFMAISPVGKGHVFAVTDPWIYNEYIGHRHLPHSFENHQAAENLTAYLISLTRHSAAH
jgi:unsaturated rhamnogalacturonyl hydrolase